MDGKKDNATRENIIQGTDEWIESDARKPVFR